MNIPLLKLAASLIGALIYAFLFTGNELGINVLLFSFLSVGLAWWFFPEQRQDKIVRYLYISTVISAVFYTWHHSGIAFTAHLFSWILLIGFLQKEAIRFVVFGAMLGIVSLLEAPLIGFRNFRELFPKSSELATLGRWVPYVLLPSTLLFIFSRIYYNANLRFAQAVDFIIPSFNWQWLWDSGFIIDFIIGALVITVLLGNSTLAPTFINLEKYIPFQLKRKQLKWFKWPFRNLSLKREYWAAVASLATLNLLLFLVNIADLRYVWVNYGHASPQELSQYVHEGTFLLIWAIILAMGVILWYFRGNLNFYSDKGLLKGLAFAWLAQNGMLALSVALRNWQYVQQYGLTYKRLGVFWFLALVAFGLIAMYQKLEKRQTIFKLIHRNAWAFFISLLLFSSINWNNAITHYNIHSNARLDIHLLFDKLSYTNLFILQKNKDEILSRSYLNLSELEIRLERKQRSFQLMTQNRSWRGWNWIDEKNKY